MEARQEIAEIVNTLPNEVLGEVLTYLRYIEKVSFGSMQVIHNLPTILTEDKEVLEKLAK